METAIQIEHPKSAGLGCLLQSNVDYANKYKQLVQDVKNLSLGSLKSKYWSEYSSWANRKHWAKKHSVEWALCMNPFAGFLLVNGPIPEKSWTLDRIDAMGAYNPSNIRWASKATQSQNRTNAIKVNFDGAMHTLMEIAQRTGRSYDAVRMGYCRRGAKYLGELLLEVAAMDPALEESQWSFPIEHREELESEYASRDQPQQNRVRFFLELAHAELSRKEFACAIANRPERRSYLEDEIAEIRRLHNEAVDFVNQIHERARWRRIEAKRQAMFGDLKGLPEVPEPDWDEPSLSAAARRAPW